MSGRAIACFLLVKAYSVSTAIMSFLFIPTSSGCARIRAFSSSCPRRLPRRYSIQYTLKYTEYLSFAAQNFIKSDCILEWYVVSINDAGQFWLDCSAAYVFDFWPDYFSYCFLGYDDY